MIELMFFFVGCFVGAGLVSVGMLVGQLHTNALKRLYRKHDCRPKKFTPR